ncbi:MAG: hypothetical protein IJQ42_02130 [Oscillospiraceae bacterium]|nr:hypothetical protein [Oscillospiraceae bacterium]
MKIWKSLLIVLCVLCMCVLFIGCETSTPRPDLSVTEMERIFLANQADFHALQEQIVPLFQDRNKEGEHPTLLISRSDAEKTNRDGAIEAELILSTDLSISEEERLALLQAAEPLFDQTPILDIFANKREVYFYFYEKWGYEHYVAYREDGTIPSGSFGNVQDSRQIDASWYAVIVSD